MNKLTVEQATLIDALIYQADMSFVRMLPFDAQGELKLFYNQSRVELIEELLRYWMLTMNTKITHYFKGLESNSLKKNMYFWINIGYLKAQELYIHYCIILAS